MSAFYIIALTACLHMTASAQVNTTTWEKKIVIRQPTIRIDSLLKVFSRQTGIEFSFNPGKVSPSRTVAIPGKEQTLSQWLTTLSQNLGIQHKVVGNHIILFGNNSSVKPPIQPPAQPRPKPSSKAPVGKAESGIPVPTTKITIITDSIQQQLPASTPAPDPVVQSPVHTVQTNTKDSILQPASSSKPVRNEQPQKSSTTSGPFTPQTVPPEKERPSASDPAFPQEAIQALFGYSHHGSGDMKGIIFGASYTRYLSHHFSLNINLLGTIHHKQDNYSYPGPTAGTRTEGAIRFTTAGVQLGIDAQLSMLRSLHHEIIFSLGGFGRYQSSSPDGYGVTPPQTSGIPEVLFSLYNWNPQNTIAAGGLLQFHYNFTFNNNMVLGLKAGIQTDTNGDLIPQAGLTIGKRF